MKIISLFCLILFYSQIIFSIEVKRKDLNSAISLRSLIVNKQHKIVYCPIQKSGSSLWVQLFHRMDGDPFWFEPPWHKKINSFSQLSLEEMNEIMNDSNWTKIIIFRDPALRLLASYFYLIANPTQVARYRINLFKTLNFTSTKWEDFLTAVLTLGHQNLHWRPQTEFCGFEKFSSLFNFVGNLETIHIHGPELLKKLGIWPTYGEKGWSLLKVISEPRSIANTPTRYQFKYPKEYNRSDCMFCSIYSSHKNNYHNLNILSEYLTEKNWNSIRNSKYYQKEYEILESINNTKFSSKLYTSYPPLLPPYNTHKS